MNDPLKQARRQAEWREAVKRVRETGDALKQACQDHGNALQDEGVKRRAMFGVKPEAPEAEDTPDQQ